MSNSETASANRKDKKIPERKKLIAEMASRLTDKDLNDIAKYDCFEERKRQFIALRILQRGLSTSNFLDPLYPREALQEYSWYGIPFGEKRNHEKRIFACCFLILNICEDEFGYLGIGTTIGNLLESILKVDPKLMDMTESLFSYVLESHLDEEDKIYALLGQFVLRMRDKSESEITKHLNTLLLKELEVGKIKEADRGQNMLLFANLKPPMLVKGWHTVRRFISDQAGSLENNELKNKIKDLCSRLWMPTDHDFYKWNKE